MIPNKQVYSRQQPCKSCPYRTDAPLAHWSMQHFTDLLANDSDPVGKVYMCHQQDGCACVGWLMNQVERNLPSNALRMSLLIQRVTPTWLDSLRCKSRLYPTVEAMCEANYPTFFTPKTHDDGGDISTDLPESDAGISPAKPLL